MDTGVKASGVFHILLQAKSIPVQVTSLLQEVGGVKTEFWNIGTVSKAAAMGNLLTDGEVHVWACPSA